MNKKYKVKIIFEIDDRDNGARFRMNLKLPFVPTKDTVIIKKDCVAIPLGPFEKVWYNHDDKHFICFIKPWKCPEEDKSRHLLQAIENLKIEGWTRID